MLGLQKAAAFPVTQNFTIIVHYVYLDALLLLQLRKRINLFNSKVKVLLQ